MNKANDFSSENIVAREDRRSIESFLEEYLRHFELKVESVEYPEDSEQTPSDARIDAIYKFASFDLHIEHSSIDLITSGSRKKRTLDPAFTALETVLKEVSCPSGRGLNVGLRLEYAKDIRALKNILEPLRSRIEEYLVITSPTEWERYPRKPDTIFVDRFEFQIRPDVLHRSDVSLHWLGSDVNFVTRPELETCLAKLLPSKLAKLNRSLSLSSRASYGILLIENTDIAAQSFHAFCGAFAGTIHSSPVKCAEVWGYRPRTDPTLVWHHEIDKERVDCAYTEDPQSRTWAEIEVFRERLWHQSRLEWIKHARDSARESDGRMSIDFRLEVSS